MLSISACINGLRMIKNIRDLFSWRSSIPAPPHSYYSIYWENKWQMWVFELPTLPNYPSKASVTGIEENVSLNPPKWRRKLTSTSLSTGVQTIILISARSPSILAKKERYAESEQLELPKSCSQCFCSWAVRCCN